MLHRNTESRLFNFNRLKRLFILLHLMCAILRAHASTRATSLMRVKNSTHHLCFVTLVVWDIGMKKIKEKTKTSNLIVDHFSLNFVNFFKLSLNVVLPYMTSE